MSHSYEKLYTIATKDGGKVIIVRDEHDNYAWWVYARDTNKVVRTRSTSKDLSRVISQMKYAVPTVGRGRYLRT